LSDIVDSLLFKACAEGTVLGVISDAHSGTIVGRPAVLTDSLVSLLLVDDRGKSDGVMWLPLDSILEVRSRTPYLDALLVAGAQHPQGALAKSEVPQLERTQGIGELLSWIARRNLFVNLGRAGSTYVHAKVVGVDDCSVSYEQYSTEYEFEGLYRIHLDEVKFVEYCSKELLLLEEISALSAG
jgi:hypothetical protein